MALPRKGDPRRPMHLAVRTMWVLGSCLVLLGFCGMGTFFIRSGRGPTLPRGILVYQFIGAMFYWIPGVLYIVFAVYLKQRRFWAVVGALILTSIELVFLVMGFVVMLVFYVSPHSDMPRFLAIPLAFIGLVVLALAQLAYHLARSFKAIELPPFGFDDLHGFEPVGLRAVATEPAAGIAPIQTRGAVPGDSDDTSPKG